MSSSLRRLHVIASSRAVDAFAHRTCPHTSKVPKLAQVKQQRCLSSSPVVFSGHSKWATIKHDKGKNDAAKSKQRALLTKDITNAVKMNGPDPNMNPRLALAISIAKKNQVPKASMEAAIARGQGLSATGAALDNVTLEAMLPQNVAVVIECATDNKLRTLSEARLCIKEAGGAVSTVGYMFEKKGRIVFQKKDGIGADEVLEPALDAGALDVVEDEEGRIVLFTEPAETKTAAETVAAAVGLEISESEIIYDPNEDTKVALDDTTAAEGLANFLEKLSEVQGLQAIYFNWAKGTIDEDLWAELQNKAAV